MARRRNGTYAFADIGGGGQLEDEYEGDDDDDENALWWAGQPQAGST